MSPSGLQLTYRPDLPALIARWQREATSAELQADYEALRAAADAARCGRWLLDLRRRQDMVEPSVIDWFNEVYVPSLRNRYAEPVRMAFLVSPLRAQRPVVVAASTDNPACEVATFTDEALAYAWLARV